MPHDARGAFLFCPVEERNTRGKDFAGHSRHNLKIRVPILFIRSAALVVASCVVPSLVQLRADQSAGSAQAEASFRTVQDETGRSVRIPIPVRRVVSLAPSMTESLYALGMDNLLVGDTDYCDYPPAAMKKHKVGGATNPSLEEIAALRPDVVLVTKSLNRLETVQQLERLGIAAYATDPHSVDEIRSSVHRLAEILGNPAAGEALDIEMTRQENGLRQRLQNIAPKRVLFVVWTDPLISVGKHTFIADALTHAGAISVVDSPQDWPQMSLEEMVRLQPEFLVFASGHSDAISRDVDALAKRPGWEELEAVKHRKFAVISDAVNRPAPRLLSAVEELARQLHPEAFSETSAARTASVPTGKN